MLGLSDWTLKYVFFTLRNEVNNPFNYNLFESIESFRSHIIQLLPLKAFGTFSVVHAHVLHVALPKWIWNFVL